MANIRLVLVFATIWLAGCTGRASHDARAALRKGDRHLVGYRGYALVVPGTPKDFNPETYKPGIKVVLNVTDTSPESEIKNVAGYAEEYNRTILNGMP